MALYRVWESEGRERVYEARSREQAVKCWAEDENNGQDELLTRVVSVQSSDGETTEHVVYAEMTISYSVINCE